MSEAELQRADMRRRQGAIDRVHSSICAALAESEAFILDAARVTPARLAAVEELEELLATARKRAEELRDELRAEDS